VTLRGAVRNDGLMAAGVKVRFEVGDSTLVGEAAGQVPAGEMAEFVAQHVPVVAGEYAYRVTVAPNGDYTDGTLADNSAETTIVIHEPVTSVPGDGGGPAGEEREAPERGDWAAAIVGAYPNPFNPSIQLVVSQEIRGALAMSIYDVRGRLVRHVLNGVVLAAGRHEVTWDGRSDSGAALPSGVYFCRLEAGSHIQTIKLALLK
jgi:hypothetical protein